MAFDFLGNELHMGDSVVALSYEGTSSRYIKGYITRLTAETALIKYEGRERRFYHGKLIKLLEGMYPTK